MTEQTPEYDPADHTVAEVNDYLADHPEQTGAVLQAESEGKGRTGITEGPHATPQEPQDGPQDAEPTGNDTLLATTSTDASTGVVGDTAGPDDEFAVKPADESAPEDVSTDPADGFVVPADAPDGTAEKITDDRPATIQEQRKPSPEGEAYQRGYVGTLPDEDNRPDLTLQGVLKNQG